MATKRQGLFLGCLFVLVAGGVLLIATSIFFSTGWMGRDLSVFGDGKVGLVLLEGPIAQSRSIVQEIEANRRDSSVKAVVIRVNSPGGEVGPSQEIYNAVLRLAEEKPVVASLGSVAASGGYYVAVGADSILADPGTLMGSIGVIMAYPNLRELMEKTGVKFEVYKSGRLKDMGSFARNPTEEEEAVFDAIIADVFDQFVSAVTDGRGMDRQQVLAVGDGRVFSGRQGLELGFVDRLGDLHAAILTAAAMGGVTGEPTVVRKSRLRIPVLDLLDQFVRESARTSWGPRLEYRLR